MCITIGDSVTPLPTPSPPPVPSPPPGPDVIVSYSTSGSVVTVGYEAAVPVFGIQFNILNGFSSAGITLPVASGGDALDALDGAGEGDFKLFYFSLTSGSFGPGAGDMIIYTFSEDDIGKTFCVEQFIASDANAMELIDVGALMCSTP